LQWDPLGGVVQQDTNLIYSQIIDITETTDVEFRIPYLASSPFLEVPARPNTLPSYYDRNISLLSETLTAFNGARHNGQFSLTVLTELTAPNDTTGIEILISARGADNLVFGGPVELSRNMTPYPLQADKSSSSIEQYGLSGESPVLDDRTFLVNMGEHITSIRQLLRRTCYSRSALAQKVLPTDNTQFRCYHAKLPLTPGFAPGGINTALSVLAPPATAAFNFVQHTPITWMAPCFIGYRGGINWTYNIKAGIPLDAVETKREFRGVSAANYMTRDNISVAVPGNSAWENWNLRTSGQGGMSLTNQRTQTGVSSYYPNYNFGRMMSTNINTRTTGTGADQSDIDQCLMTFNFPPATQDWALVDFYCAIGTDFNFIFFLNCPSYQPLGAITPPPP